MQGGGGGVKWEIICECICVCVCVCVCVCEWGGVKWELLKFIFTSSTNLI